MKAAENLEVALLERSQLYGETDRAVHAVLKEAFPDLDGDYYQSDHPDRIILLSTNGQPIGHLAAYVRTVAVGNEELTIGLIGGVAVDARHRLQGHAKHLVREAHRFFAEQALPFSVLFAFDPERYQSSGYRLMTNETRFLKKDGTWKQVVFNGGMVAELTGRPWPGKTLDLRGPAV